MLATMAMAATMVLSADTAWKPTFNAEAKATARLKENTNDPAKFSIVRMSKPFNPRGWRIDEERLYSVAVEGVAVYVKYRSANPFGAVVLDQSVIIFKSDGSFVRQCDAALVHPPGKDIRLEERFTDEFLGAYRH